MIQMFKEFASTVLSDRYRSRVLFLLFLTVILTQFPFSELLGLKSGYPYLIRIADWPRLGLHAFQSLCVSGILFILYERVRAYWSGSFQGWKKEGFFFFLMLLCYWLYWIPLGFDVTDEGRRMAHSWFMYLGLWDMHDDLRMGGHLLKGLWLHILPGPSVLWGRFGYALIKSTMGLLAFLILRRAFPHRRFEVFCLAFVAGLTVSIYGGQVINYNNVPVTFMLGAVFSFQVAVQKGKGGKASRAAFLGGVLIPLAVLSRFPFVILIAMPFLWSGLARIVGKRVNGFPSIPVLPSLGGVLTGILAVILLLGSTDSLGGYWNTIDNKLIEGFFQGADESLESHSHDRASLMELYTRDLKKLILVQLRIFPFFLLLGIFGLLSGKWRQLSTLILSLVAFYFFPAIVELKDWYHGIISIPIGLFLFFLVSERRLPPSPFVAFWGLVLFGSSFLGSNNGVINILITGGGSLFIGYTLMLLREMTPSKKLKKADPLPVLASCILFLPLYVMHRKPHEIYRDGKQEELTRMMGDPSLFGVFSTPARVKKVDGVMKAAREHITPYKDKLLAVNTIPVFYYLTQTPYSFSKSWTMKDMSEAERQRALSGPDGPDHILMMHRSPRYWDWPNVDVPCREQELPYYRFFKNYLKGPAYQKVYDNGCFTLHNKVIQGN